MVPVMLTLREPEGEEEPVRTAEALLLPVCISAPWEGLAAPLLEPDTVTVVLRVGDTE
jgi:hypothetical protein